MGERFFTFKAKVTDLTKTVQGHFNKIISDIMHGMPEVEELEGEEDENLQLDAKSLGLEWTCRTCMRKNPIASENCGTCSSAKPSLKPLQPVPVEIKVEPPQPQSRVQRNSQQ